MIDGLTFLGFEPLFTSIIHYINSITFHFWVNYPFKSLFTNNLSLDLVIAGLVSILHDLTILHFS